MEVFMNFEMDDYHEYTDRVVYDFIKFLHDKMDSENDIESSYTRLESHCETKLGSLFDGSQYITFYDDDNYYYFCLLENNKLLKIEIEQTETNIDPVFISFVLYSDASQYMVSCTPITSNSSRIKIFNKQGEQTHTGIVFPFAVEISKKSTDKILNPTSTQQILERSKESYQLKRTK